MHKKNFYRSTNQSPTRGLSGSTKQKIKLSLLGHAYKLSSISLLTALLIASLAVAALYRPYAANMLLISWYTIFIVVTIGRAMITHLYKKQKRISPHFLRWRILFIIGALFGGMSWGLLGCMILTTPSVAQQTFITLVLAGIAGGGAPILAADLIATFAFLSAALLPAICILYYSNYDSTTNVFGIAGLVYLIYLYMLSIKLHSILKTSLSLKFENDLLVDHLSYAKNQLENSNKKLAHAATHDPLTSLANRNLFEATLTAAIKHAKNNNQIIALLYIDLDNFKEINDVYGHSTGDKLLIQLVERLLTHTRKIDTISRLGGDEMTVILENIPNPDTAVAVAQALCAIAAEPFLIGPHTLHVTASIGISIYPTDGQDAGTLLRNADKAMYYVKQHGRNNFRFSTGLVDNAN